MKFSQQLDFELKSGENSALPTLAIWSWLTASLWHGMAAEKVQPPSL